MTNQELFKQAIADAKSVRDAAVANAKAALEETFTPQIMAMLSNQLNELEEDVNLEEKKEETEEGYGNKEEGLEPAGSIDQSYDGQQHPSLEETNLEELLAQLSEDDDETDSVSEAKDKDEKGKKSVEEAKDKDEDKKKKVEESLDEAEGNDEVTELTVDELKDMIRDVITDVMGGEEKGEEGDETGDESEGDDAKELDLKEFNLDELLAELAEEDNVNESKEEKEEKMKKKKVEESAVNEGDVSNMIQDLIQQVAQSPAAVKAALVDMGVPADKIGTMLSSLAALGGTLGAAAFGICKDKAAGGDPKVGSAFGADSKSTFESKTSKDLEEAIQTINILRDELNEVNLLNAKLLYSNKIFKAKSLSESQKVNVLKAFDRATSIKETKTIYAALTESLSTKPKSTIKESVGFASKAAGVAPKQPIVEGDSAIRRMQQLAGIIK